jgi:protein-tyrosine kinase
MSPRGVPAEPHPALITLNDPKSMASEAYRTLRTNIQFARLERRCHSIVITSASPEEGKTTSVANFAVVAAQAGSRVCVVDSDLRRPRLHRLFGIRNTYGLTTALLEGRPFAEVAQPAITANLAVLPSGPLPPNPGELVSSQRMREALETAAETFDLVLCDSPPVLAVADAAALAAQCDGVILVIRSGHTAHAALTRAVEQIQVVKGRVLGILLNRAELPRDTYYQY